MDSENVNGWRPEELREGFPVLGRFQKGGREREGRNRVFGSRMPVREQRPPSRWEAAENSTQCAPPSSSCELGALQRQPHVLRGPHEAQQEPDRERRPSFALVRFDVGIGEVHPASPREQLAGSRR